jgi:two-component system chemotaxis response regulator CheY
MAKKVMIVDDAAFMRATLKDVLTKNGYEVAAEAVNGEDAIAKYKLFHPDCVLMDITMPEMDGLTSMKEIKAHDAKAVIIMCSAVGQQQNVMDAISSGAKDFVVKPFKPERVIEAVKKAIGE